MAFSFLQHPRYEKEAAKIIKRLVSYNNAIDSFALLCQKQFDPIHPQPVIGPGKIHRVHDAGVYSIWKIELVVVGLRKNQCPRLWFAVQGETVVCLCVAMHGDNYSDDQATKEALMRVSEYF